MSEAFQDDDQTPPAGEVQPTGDEQTPAAELVGGSDYWERVTSDPDFAREQITMRDKKLGEHGRRIQALEPVEEMVKLAGTPENVLGYLNTMARIQQMPELAELVNSSLTQGRLALPEQTTPNASPETDEWVDPDVAAAVNPLRSELEEVRKQLAQVTGQLHQTDLRSQERYVEQNSKAALEMFSGNSEALEAATNLLSKEIQATYARAQAGDRQQAELYKQISGPGGERIMQSVLFDLYREWAPKLVAPHTTEPNAERVLDRATDPRPQNAASPGQVQLPPPPKGRLGVQDVVATIRAAGRQIGVDTTKL